MKLYSPELFNEITSPIEVEYIQPSYVNKAKFISDGVRYILGNILCTQELSNPYLSAYSALHNGEKMTLANGSIVSVKVVNLNRIRRLFIKF
jgi:hypothetical protein